MARPIVLLGAGVLGRRIATVFVAGGYTVHIRDPSLDALAAAAEYIDSYKEAYFCMTKSSTIGTFQTFTDLSDAVQNAWLVIEAVPENLDIKIATFAELERLTKTDCILASNSSSFKSSLMVEKLRERRKRVLNMHFTMPPDIRTVELMTDGETEEQLFQELKNVLETCGMAPVVARKESTGFIFNRLWAAIKREILLILAEGVSEPAQIDLLWKSIFQSPKSLPPCRLMDQIGLDTVAFIEDNYIQERCLDSTPVDWLRDQYIKQGKLGLKSGSGLYSSNSNSNDSLYVLDIGFGANSPPHQSGQILRLNLNTNELDPVITGQNLPDGIDISCSTSRLFWSNMGASTSTYDGSIHSANLDGSDIRVLLPPGLVHTPKQLLVDDVNQRVYFCDREGMSIHRCDFEGGHHEVLLERGNPHTDDKKDMTRWCVGIAIDLVHHHLYWTQKGPSKGGQGRIFRAGLEISGGETASTRSDIELLAEGLPEPIDLDLDIEGQVLYWTDRGEHPVGCTLNRMELANGKREILARQFHEPIGLKVRGDGVYVCDLGGSIYRVGKGKEKEVIYNGGCFTGLTLH